MVMLARPNFFLLLDLLPDAAWDQATFEKKLRDKRIEWSRQCSGVARKALTARQNLALISQIQRVMTDSALREQEAKLAREELAASSRAAYAQFEKQLALMNAKDVVEQEELDRFIAAFEHLFSAAEIRSRLQVQVALPGVVARKAPPPLEPAVSRSIADRLSFLQMRTLYTLLQVPAITSTAMLSRSAEQLYIRLVALQPTAEIVAKMELAGLASEVFKSDEMRASYDESLRLAAFSRMLTELEESVSRSTEREVHAGQVMLFLEQARKEGWDAQEALDKLKEYARLHQWVVMVPALSPPEDTLLCPGCQHFNPANQHYCSTCRQALYTECPGCGRLVSCECPACGYCSFPVGNRYLVDNLLEEVQDLLRQGEGETASEVLKHAEWAWPSLSGDVRVRQIESCHAAVKSLLNIQKQAQTEVQQYLAHLSICTSQEGGQDRVHISYEPPSHGTVLIFQSNHPLQLESQILPVSQIDQLGRCLEKHGNVAIDDWRPGELVYYTPVLLLHQRIYPGPSQRYVCVAGVRDLVHQHLGSVLRLRWNWPQDCQEVLLSYHTESWPGDHAPPATTIALSRAQYDQRGYYDLGVIVHRDYYVVISAVMKRDNEQFLADGVRTRARLTSRIVITYEIRNATKPGGRRTLHLITEPYTALPILLLVSKQGGLPLRKADGEVVQRIQVTSEESKRLITDLSPARFAPNTFGKLFFEDDSNYGEFMIHHPGENQMRLG